MSATERLRDYAIAEGDCGYTIAYAAWELKLSVSAVNAANNALLKLGIVHEILPKVGREGAVYAYAPIPEGKPNNVQRLFPELDTGAYGRAPVPLTGKASGPSGRPGRDRRKQLAGHRVKRARQGT